MNRRRFLVQGASVLAASSLTRAAEAQARIRIAQIGTAHAHASGKMEALRRMQDLFEVVGAAESDEAQRQKASQSGPFAGLDWLSEDAILGDKTITALTVETRIERSLEVAARAIAAGKHIHLDKPGALDHDGYVRMRREAEAKGLTVQMGYMLRYNPAFQLLFHAVREGWFGEILEVDAAMGKLADPSTRGVIRKLEGGGMFELACHVIDATLTVLGKPAEVQGFSTPSRAPDDMARDNQLAVLVFPKATATIRCNHADPFGGPRRFFQVAGTKGGMRIQSIESGKGVLYLDQAREGFKKGEQTFELDVPKGRYDGEFQDLARILHGQSRLAWSADHDIAVHETVLRAAGMR